MDTAISYEIRLPFCFFDYLLAAPERPDRRTIHGDLSNERGYLECAAIAAGYFANDEWRVPTERSAAIAEFAATHQNSVLGGELPNTIDGRSLKKCLVVACKVWELGRGGVLDDLLEATLGRELDQTAIQSLDRLLDRAYQLDDLINHWPLKLPKEVMNRSIQDLLGDAKEIDSEALYAIPPKAEDIDELTSVQATLDAVVVMMTEAWNRNVFVWKAFDILEELLHGSPYAYFHGPNREKLTRLLVLSDLIGSIDFGALDTEGLPQRSRKLELEWMKCAVAMSLCIWHTGDRYWRISMLPGVINLFQALSGSEQLPDALRREFRRSGPLGRQLTGPEPSPKEMAQLEAWSEFVR